MSKTRKPHGSGNSRPKSNPSPPADKPASKASSSAGTSVHPEALDGIGNKIKGTSERINSVADKVGGVNLGPQSMGLLGSTFTGQAQDSVRRAQQATAKVGKGMDNAHVLTKQTAQTYRDVDTSSAKAFEKVHTDTSSTRTSDATKPSNATSTTGNKVSAPPTTNGSTTPASTPAAVGDKVDPPPTPGGSDSTPPDGHRPTDPNRLPTWIETAKQKFTPKEFQDFQTALRKMAEDPISGQVPGSGRLDAHERDLMARAQSWTEVTPDTMMQKALSPGLADKMISGEAGDGSHNIGGCFARQQDATHLKTPGDFYDGLRLDYPNSTFNTTDAVQVIEFPAGNPKDFSIPYGGPAHSADGLPKEHPDVRQATKDMGQSVAAVTPSSYSAGASAGGSHAPVVNNCRSASSLSRPHFVAVSR